MKKIVLSALGLLALAGCSGGDGGGGGGTSTRVATTVTLTAGALNFDAVGALQVVHATVKDQSGVAMSGAPLTWNASSPAVVIASQAGDSAVIVSSVNGSGTLTATSGAASGSLTVQVAQVASTLQKTAGDGQTATAGSALVTQIRVKVLDRLGMAVAGAQVAFNVTQGGGNVGGSQVSGADGTAASTWTLGPVAGAPQQARATASGVGTPADFSATAVPGPPAAVSVNAGNNQTAAPGTAVATAPSVRVTDALGNPIAGVGITFAVTGGGGSITGATQTTDASGVAVVGSWTLGSAGPQSLSATATGSGLSTTISATAGAGGGTVTATPSAGNNQAGMAGAAVEERPSVTVRDGSNNPVAGASVAFAVTGGGGSVTGANTTTNASGVATVGSWQLGTLAAPNDLKATITGPGIATPVVVNFRAVGCSGGGGAGYAITLCFTTPMTSSQRAVFESAASRWGSLVTGDLPNVDEDIEAGTCGASPLVRHVDDLLIFAGIEDIDGPGQVLGSAGWCWRRDSTAAEPSPSRLPFIGIMRFDQADVQTLELDGQLGSVILHEMGHVLGIGTMWTTYGLLANPQVAGTPPHDVLYSGAQGILGFNNIGGTTYTGGGKVPLENTGGAGTMNGHWRESVLNNELMTGYLNSGANPLSQLTVRSLADIGYVVNVSGADPFFLTLSVSNGAPARGRLLEGDVYNGPAYKMSRSGRRTRISRTEPVRR